VNLYLPVDEEHLKVPRLVAFGSDDPAQKISEGEDSNYEGPFRRVIVEGTGPSFTASSPPS
jgi:hypothetical protein